MKIIIILAVIFISLFYQILRPRTILSPEQRKQLIYSFASKLEPQDSYHGNKDNPARNLLKEALR